MHSSFSPSNIGTLHFFPRQMLPLIYLRKLMSQLPFLLLDGSMKLSNHLIFRVHRIGNVLFTSFCYYYCTFCNVLTKQPYSWWGLVEKSWGTLRSYPIQLPFYSDFNQVVFLIALGVAPGMYFFL